MSELDAFRQAKDDFFARDAHSPLTREQKRSFRGLEYFPENPDLCFELPLEVFNSQDEIEIQTSSGDVQSYRRLGRLYFEVEGETVSLVLYQGQHGFYLPFVDALSGSETYPAGRYLEPEELDNGLLLVDFNYAYNPYCAYNDRWSCPLTPFENRLKVALRAGEKVFPH